MRSQYEDEATAFHEAAHAVAAAFFGVPAEVEAVSIEEDNSTDGHVAFGKEVKPTRENVDFFIIQQLVGRFGQKKHTSFDVGVEANNDYDRAAQYACYFNLTIGQAVPEGEIDAPFFEPYNERATKFVDEHWDTIERVAKALLDQRTIAGPELKRLIRT